MAVCLEFGECSPVFFLRKMNIFWQANAWRPQELQHILALRLTGRNWGPQWLRLHGLPLTPGPLHYIPQIWERPPHQRGPHGCPLGHFPITSPKCLWRSRLHWGRVAPQQLSVSTAPKSEGDMEAFAAKEAYHQERLEDRSMRGDMPALPVEGGEEL